MIIDNIALIRSLLQFPPKDVDGKVKDEKYDAQMKAHQSNPKTKDIDMRDCFYVVQLIQRQKDNPKAIYANKNFRNNSNRTLQQFQIYSLEDFDLKAPLIVELAKVYQARAYIELNLKDSKDVFAELFKNMQQRFATGNYTKLHKMYNEAVGETNAMARTRKTWLVDIDTKDRQIIDEMKNFVVGLNGGGANGKAEVLAEVPTKNGVHLITTSFQMDVFKRQYPNIDVWKRNPTIMWMETDWTKYQ